MRLTHGRGACGAAVLKVFSNADVAVLVYTPAGQLARASSSSSFPDDEFAVEFAVDGAGNAYAVALLLHPPKDYGVRNIDALTYKFDAAGALASRRVYANVNNNLDSAKGVALDGAGGVHVGISAQQGSQANESYVVVKYGASDGAKLDEKSFDGPGRRNDRLFEIEIDSAGNLYLTGETDMDPATYRSVDFMTLKVGSAAPPSRPPVRVNVAAAANGATAFRVEYWTGSAWAQVPGASVTGNNRVWRRFTFAPLTTTKIRVVVTGGLTGVSRLTEIEAF